MVKVHDLLITFPTISVLIKFKFALYAVHQFSCMPDKAWMEIYIYGAGFSI